jgi:ABC-type multidrug transport system fused ATPase/permease subunit
MVASYGLYTTVQGQTLTAASVFSSLSVFELIREQMFMVTWLANTSITAAVSIRRLNEYLNKTELLDRFDQDREAKDVPGPNAPTDRVSVKDASFTWNKPDPEARGGRNFRLKVDNLQFEQGKLNIVAGATGSGKTSWVACSLAVPT